MKNKWYPIETLKEDSGLLFFAYRCGEEIQITCGNCRYNAMTDKLTVWNNNDLEVFPIAPTHWMNITLEGMIDNDK